MRQANNEERWFTFYLLEEFALNAFSSAIEALRLANEVNGGEIYRWRVVSSDGQAVRSSCGMHVPAAASLADERGLAARMDAPCMVVICGGSSVPAPDKAAEAWLRSCRRSRIAISGLSGGSYVLARASLLDGRRCAVHWTHFPDFSEAFLDAEAVQTAFEIDDEVYTCAGGNAPFDMFLRIVEGDCGLDVINRMCEIALLDRVRDVGERQRLPLQARVGVDNLVLIRIIERMQANIAEPLKLSQLSPASGMSRRQMERLFRKEMGRSPARYYLEMRLERAHLLLVNSSLPVIDIAMACGFASASHFSRTYRENYGCTPLQMRTDELERRARPRGHRPESRPHSLQLALTG